ncbi:MAG: hypothetical protein COU10_00810 [Candidatus Harrisonbacteria bacterium CG10_big_fil_rev_8_21_14_0_10_45_28]|uniref:Cell division protein FtsL n=1 Tax=Candidatus Harrisonbacteria bacterium CG10_big_fil_rev_8_21_14_0_10_45_28 TaxID=1974586 RepID=A0A2H0UQR4_9BACT|nr:MAG: hypothetical protein COU10_00810 [Candidatus Harrisonbacteria bacterium CG10_big_fil_rev_8_21_14_0_10_45_28]
MTTNQRTTNRYLNFCRRIALFGIGVSLVGCIFVYYQNISTRKNARELAQVTEDLRTENAELKNQLYSLLSSESLMQAATALALVKENNPNYLTLNATSKDFVDISEAIQDSLTAVPAEPVVAVRLIAKNVR